MPAYLKASLKKSLETNEMSIFQLAIQDVAEAQGGIAKESGKNKCCIYSYPTPKVSSEIDVGRESFYKTLSPKGKPRFATIMQALKARGFEMDFTQLI